MNFYYNKKYIVNNIMDISKNLKDKFSACIVLHSLGDTIGFRNGKWEFFGMHEFVKTNKLNFNLANELLYEFIALGGINEIKLEKWYASDDTLLHLDLIETLLKYDNFDEIKKNLIKKFIDTKHKYFDNRVNVDRVPGITTVKYIEAHEKGTFIEKYDILSGGNGAAMRSLAIGLYYSNDLDMLINASIELSKITHNSAIGYLGGLTSAYFVYLAINLINLHEWPYKLINLLESDKIEKYIKLDEEKNDYKIYIDNWKKYLEMRFDDNKIPGYRRTYINIVYRTQFHYEYFTDKSKSFIPGSSGCSVNIMAYDALLDAENNWEKLVVYSMLHLGDSDTVGCIAAGWYGALYGFGDVPSKNIEHLEFKDKLYDFGKKLYNKFSHIK